MDDCFTAAVLLDDLYFDKPLRRSATNKECAMQQAVTATWVELLAGASAITIFMIGGTWAVIGVFVKNLQSDYRIIQTQEREVQVALNSLAISVAEMKASMPTVVGGLTEMLDSLDKLRGEVNIVEDNIARIKTFLGHLAGTPPSFPSDLK
jgi:hypothetical protein